MPKGSKDNNRGNVMFDIEYYMEKSEVKNDYWFSDIHCLPCIKGITYFLKDKQGDNNFDYDEFVNLGEEIQEIRGLLYERYNNKPKIYDEARVFHYKVFGKILEEKIEAFANKYNLHINRD
jgi:pyruvate/oxaloacetate carboxyltransferase